MPWKLVIIILSIFYLIIGTMAQEPQNGGEGSDTPVVSPSEPQDGGEGSLTPISQGNGRGYQFKPLEFKTNNISCNKTCAFRNNWIQVIFNIEGVEGKSDDCETMAIDIPDDFDSVKSDYLCSYNERKLIIPWNTAKRVLNVSFVGQISKNHDLNPIIISSNNITFTKSRKNTESKCVIYMNNSIPNILGFYEDKKYHKNINEKNYIGDQIYLNLTCRDEDDDELTYELYDKNCYYKNVSGKINLMKSLNRTKSIEIPYILQNPGTEYIYAVLNDRFDSPNSEIISISIENETRKQHELGKIFDNTLYITFLVILLSSLGLVTFIKRQWILSILSIILAILFFTIIFLKFFLKMSVEFTPIFALLIYPFIMTFALYFIINNFPEKNYKDNIYSYISIIFMGFSMILLCHLFSLDFHLDKDAFYMSYNSVIILFLGGILTIITAFSAFMDNFKGNPKDKDKFKKMIRLFTILYISIIFMALLGLVTGFKLELNLNGTLDYASMLSLISFEFTLLLIMPALVMLYAFIDWIIERK